MRASTCCWPVTASRMSSSTAEISPNVIVQITMSYYIQRTFSLNPVSLSMIEKNRSYRDEPLAAYHSPKNSNSRSRQMFLSPIFEQKYPLSQKYNSPFPAPRPLLSQQYSPSHHQQSSILQSSQLRLTISQLKNSLQIATENAQRLQDELFSQRKRTYELTEIKRRLQEELEKMQFEFQRMGSYEALQGRQASIKLETALRENARIGQQVADLLDENKSLKQEQRKLMSEIDRLMHERTALAKENEDLLDQLRQLEGQVGQVKRQLHSQSSLTKAPTYRSQHVPTVIGSANSIPLEPLEEVDYELQSQKLLADYQQLMIENQSIKRLQKEFFSGSSPKSQLFRQEEPIPKSSKEGEAQQGIRSFSNHQIAERLSSDPKAQTPAPQMFRTQQKDQLKQQLQSLREEAVAEIKRCYSKALSEAETRKNNALKIFIQEIGKNVSVLGRMAQNYLQLRATVRQEAGIQLPEPVEELQGEGNLVLQMYRSVKQKAKKQGGSGLVVAVFRLLTLLSRCQSIPKVLFDNMQHSCLKYVYKLANTPTKA